jgi:thiol-disulfide isomerase/thioredoxin
MLKKALFNKKILLILIITFFLLSQYVFATTCPLKGDLFPDINLKVPKTEGDKLYLGLEEKQAFKISDIKSEIIIIEIFSMYCPYCQKEAPIVNELFDKINKNLELKDKIKLLGIGAGNTQFEVDIFRENFKIEFPLIPDEEFLIHKAIGEVRTPYFFVIKKINNKNNIIYSNVGTIGNPENFLNMIINNSTSK